MHRIRLVPALTLTSCLLALSACGGGGSGGGGGASVDKVGKSLDTSDATPVADMTAEEETVKEEGMTANDVVFTQIEAMSYSSGTPTLIVNAMRGEASARARGASQVRAKAVDEDEWDFTEDIDDDGTDDVRIQGSYTDDNTEGENSYSYSGKDQETITVISDFTDTVRLWDGTDSRSLTMTVSEGAVIETASTYSGKESWSEGSGSDSDKFSGTMAITGLDTAWTDDMDRSITVELDGSYAANGKGTYSWTEESYSEEYDLELAMDLTMVIDIDGDEHTFDMEGTIDIEGDEEKETYDLSVYVQVDDGAVYGPLDEDEFINLLEMIY
ncbi:MAG: hypothetical protein ACOCXA_03885 [Planctomycetota bacterium]